MWLLRSGQEERLMTPEARAREVYRLLYGSVQDTPLLATMTNAIHAAVAEERACCAKAVCEMCEEIGPPQFDAEDGFWFHEWKDKWRWSCDAAAIYARSEPTP
jgi:hypothetical protein